MSPPSTAAEGHTSFLQHGWVLFRRSRLFLLVYIFTFLIPDRSSKYLRNRIEMKVFRGCSADVASQARSRPAISSRALTSSVSLHGQERQFKVR